MSDSTESDRLADAPHPRETAVLFGHAMAERAMLDAYRAGRVPQAWLLGGPKGIGKATLAWRFARFLLAHPDPTTPAVQAATSLAVAATHPVAVRLRSGSVGDLAVLRRQWNEKSKRFYDDIRVDDVRAALGLFQRAAGAGGYRLCLVDCAEDLNRSSANALLKTIEEPPARAVVLIVSHQPSQVLPTILSRCRKLVLGPLPPAEVGAALDAMPPADPPPALADRQAAIARSGGSVGRALRLLDEGRRTLDAAVLAELARLPALDPRALYRLADRLAAADQDDAVALLLETMLDWIDARVRELAGQGQPARNLAPLAEVWDKLHASASEAVILNLDKRPLILSLFAALADAVRMAGRT